MDTLIPAGKSPNKTDKTTTKTTHNATKTNTKATTYLPNNDTRADIVDFAKLMRQIEQFLAPDGKAALTAPDGTSKPIPDEIFRALEQVANALANGNGVTVAPYSMLMTTQEAADFLGISRPTFVKIVESGEIPHEKRGRHRRVTLRNVVDYQNRSKIDRRAALMELAVAGQAASTELGAIPPLKRLSES